MNLLELIHRARQQLDDEGGDTGSPPAGYTYYWEYEDRGTLWKNETLVYYFNNASQELAHRIPLVKSHEAEYDITRVALAAGKSVYSIDTRVLAVDNAILQSTGLPLVKVADADERSKDGDPWDRRYADPSPVQQYRVDLDSYTLTVYAAPIESDTLLLTVRHLPLYDFQWASRKSQTSEFPEHYDQALITWACSMALLKRDADTYDLRESDRYRGMFTDQVGPRIDFNLTRIRQEVAGKRLRTRTYY